MVSRIVGVVNQNDWCVRSGVLEAVWKRDINRIFKNLNFFFVKIKKKKYVLDCFDVLISKIIFKK
jgi:hypothetical protein